MNFLAVDLAGKGAFAWPEGGGVLSRPYDLLKIPSGGARFSAFEEEFRGALSLALRAGMEPLIDGDSPFGGIHAVVYEAVSFGRGREIASIQGFAAILCCPMFQPQ